MALGPYKSRRQATFGAPAVVSATPDVEHFIAWIYDNLSIFLLIVDASLGLFMNHAAVEHLFVWICTKLSIFPFDGWFQFGMLWTRLLWRLLGKSLGGHYSQFQGTDFLGQKTDLCLTLVGLASFFELVVFYTHSGPDLDGFIVEWILF